MSSLLGVEEGDELTVEGPLGGQGAGSTVDVALEVVVTCRVATKVFTI